MRLAVEAPLWTAFSLLAMGTMAAAPGPVGAQQPADSVTDTAAASEADSLQLVFEREVFNYPQYERRNPFQPLTGSDVSGPRFEDMVLLGVVLQPNPQESVAVLGARPPGATSDEPPSRTYRVRVGESLGNMRMIEIGQREVLFEVGDFGVSETRSLSLRRPPPASSVPPFGTGAGPDTTSAPEAAPTPSDSVAALGGLA